MTPCVNRGSGVCCVWRNCPICVWGLYEDTQNQRWTGHREIMLFKTALQKPTGNVTYTASIFIYSPSSRLTFIPHFPEEISKGASARPSRLVWTLRGQCLPPIPLPSPWERKGGGLTSATLPCAALSTTHWWSFYLSPSVSDMVRPPSKAAAPGCPCLG